MRWRFVLPILALSIPVLSLTWPQTPSQIVSEARRGPSRGIVGTLPMTDPDEQYAQVQLAGFYAGVQRDVDAYLAALEAQRRADEEAARRATRSTTQGMPTLRSGNCCGPHSDAWWWGVAICEQGGRNDPYFGYFSWMDGSAAGLTWEQQVAKSNALLARVSSESPAWAPSCVAAGYAASPGG